MNKSMNPTSDDFASMFESSAAAGAMQEGQVIPATVLRIDNDAIVVDIGLKTEGRIPIKEFALEDKQPAPGDIVDVYLDRIENALGEAVLSRDKARREERWVKLERSFAKGEPVKGAISGRVKGGFTVDLGGVNAFLPGSQVDIRPVRDVGPLMGEVQPFAVLKLDRVRGNIVVSRRAILEESRAEQRAEIVNDMAEGDVRKGIVKNITDYGAFVDLGGIDGLLHVTDMSYKRINHPSQVVEVGQEVEVQIIKINPETQRISLGMKQLGSDPWDNISSRYPSGARLKGTVTNITDYGAFVELEDGVEGLIHVSEMSLASSRPWTIRGTPSWPNIRSVRKSRAKCAASPSSACSWASAPTWTAWCTSTTSRGTSPVTRRSKPSPRVTASRRRSWMSMSTRNASRSASSNCRVIRSKRRVNRASSAARP